VTNAGCVVLTTHQWHGIATHITVWQVTAADQQHVTNGRERPASLDLFSYCSTRHVLQGFASKRVRTSSESALLPGRQTGEPTSTYQCAKGTFSLATAPQVRLLTVQQHIVLNLACTAAHSNKTTMQACRRPNVKARMTALYKGAGADG
jgi:hypothetical protein